MIRNIKEWAMGVASTGSESRIDIPYSYTSVSHPGLKASLEGFEEHDIPRVDTWPIILDDLYYTDLYFKLGFQVEPLRRIVEYVRRYDALSLVTGLARGLERPAFDKDGMRAFAAVYATYEILAEEGQGQISPVHAYLAIPKAVVFLGSHPLANGINLDKYMRKPNFLAHPFWETLFGQALVAIDKGVNKETFHLLLDTKQVAQIFGFSDSRRATYFVEILVKSGVIAHMSRDGANRDFTFNYAQGFIAALFLAYLEKGHSLKSAQEIISKLLEGTDLQPFIGQVEPDYKESHRLSGQIFTPNSAWAKLPIEPVVRGSGIPRKEEVGKKDLSDGEADHIDEPHDSSSIGKFDLSGWGSEFEAAMKKIKDLEERER